MGCREMKDKRELIRVVRTPEETVVIDPTGKLSGRGAYLCQNVECLQKALKNKGLERSLKVQIGEEVKTALQHKLEALPKQTGDEDDEKNSAIDP